MSKVPVILDTDIGSDIDDAVCLAYLLRQPKCELLGVTTVSGKVLERAALADAVCRAAGRRDIPIHAGCSHGINLSEVQPNVPQASVLPRFDHRAPSEFKPGTAIEFLRDQINARPGEITLLAIGPMTNLGVLFTIDPDIPKKLKSLVLMCGVFTNQIPYCSKEWNALCDPVATSITYRAPIQPHLSIGLDVTMKCQLPSEECIKRFNDIGGPLKVVAAMTEVWAKGGHKVTFHDPLAATVIFKPEICKWADGKVDVELKSDRAAGMTHWDPRAQEKPHKIAVEVNPEAFFNEYFEVTGKR
ncbi:MAG TPA: nucleoside hydrolase [Planctomycetota bacterium]|nr:nucleoside hydrolase [Planctomycetota bacterium]